VNVNINVYSDISDAETLKNSTFLQQLMPCIMFSQRYSVYFIVSGVGQGVAVGRQCRTENSDITSNSQCSLHRQR